jgi:hypothetical protein
MDAAWMQGTMPGTIAMDGAPAAGMDAGPPPGRRGYGHHRGWTVSQGSYGGSALLESAEAGPHPARARKHQLLASFLTGWLYLGTALAAERRVGKQLRRTALTEAGESPAG